MFTSTWSTSPIQIFHRGTPAVRANVGNSILSEVAKDCHQVNWVDSIAVSLFTNNEKGDDKAIQNWERVIVIMKLSIVTITTSNMVDELLFGIFYGDFELMFRLWKRWDSRNTATTNYFWWVCPFQRRLIFVRKMSKSLKVRNILGWDWPPLFPILLHIFKFISVNFAHPNWQNHIFSES